MGSTWGPPGSCRPQIGPMLVPWTLLSGLGYWLIDAERACLRHYGVVMGINHGFLLIVHAGINFKKIGIKITNVIQKIIWKCRLQMTTIFVRLQYILLCINYNEDLSMSVHAFLLARLCLGQSVPFIKYSVILTAVATFATMESVR